MYYLNDLFFGSLKHRSIGYLSFVLHGLSLLKKYTGENNFWNSEKFNLCLNNKLIKFVNSPDYFSQCKNNKYSFQYNPVGFELMSFAKTFNINMDNKFFDYQIKKHWNDKDGLLNKNTVDPDTLSARLYEIIYLLD